MVSLCNGQFAFSSIQELYPMGVNIPFKFLDLSLEVCLNIMQLVVNDFGVMMMNMVYVCGLFFFIFSDELYRTYS